MRLEISRNRSASWFRSRSFLPFAYLAKISLRKKQPNELGHQQEQGSRQLTESGRRGLVPSGTCGQQSAHSQRLSDPFAYPQEKARAHLHHHLKLALFDHAVLVLVAALDHLEQVVDEARLDGRAVAERVDGPQRRTDDTEVRVDLERVLVVLVRKERRDLLDRKSVV